MIVYKKTQTCMDESALYCKLMLMLGNKRREKRKIGWHNRSVSLKKLVCVSIKIGTFGEDRYESVRILKEIWALRAV